jgi:SAM-dependent methyltransferase/uncharacterized protein YbaR (Trm112 family)
MDSFDTFLSLLQCPFCEGGFSFLATASEPGRGMYGILTCLCSKYPVIDDVPILMKGSVGIISHWNDRTVHLGPTSQELVEALEGGATTEALMDCLVFPRKFPLQGRLTRAHLWPGGLGYQAGLAVTREQLRRMLTPRDGRLRAQDLFLFFHSRRSGNNPDLADYFLNRFVMPRYLSAMSLVQRLGASEQPVLDIACGYGHFAHYLTKRRRATPAIGLDFNFYQLWAGKKLVAPEGWFVCCDAGVPLPLKSGTCSGAICSDAFMLLPDKTLLSGEVDRVAPKRPAIYARVGIRQVGPLNPPHGGEMLPEEYWELFGRDRSRYFVDDVLWKDYLMRRNPLDRDPVSLEGLRWEKYLSYVVNPEALSEGEEEGVWCHGVGKLALNPATRVTADRPDALVTEFMYRTIWGAYEDADMISYTERWGKIEKAELRSALADPAGDAANRLVGRFALIGVPEHYFRSELAA